MKEKVALVSGAAMGIGRATALALADDGWAVGVADIDEVLGRQTCQLIEERGGRSVMLTVDLASRQSIADSVELCRKILGPITGLSHNAVAVRPTRAEDMNESDWNLIMSVGVTAAWHLVREVLPDMRANGGSIVLTSSIQAWRAAPSAFAYDTAKAALLGMTRQLSTEYGVDGVRTNAVLPGAIATRLVPDDTRTWFSQSVPMKRIGEPSEVGNAIAFLMSDRASYINGASLVVDGGWSTAAWTS